MASDDESLLRYSEGGQILDLDTLESHLWEAADILRGSIDAADYKNYIFGLLFLKRINDRFEEETEEIAEEYDVDEETVRNDRDLHEEFWVPDRARWDHIAAQDTDIGATLNKALEAVEDENDAIADRVLTSVDFNDKERLSDATLDEWGDLTLTGLKAVVIGTLYLLLPTVIGGGIVLGSGLGSSSEGALAGLGVLASCWAA
jgi:type I restriction enzyme M protein